MYAINQSYGSWLCVLPCVKWSTRSLIVSIGGLWGNQHQRLYVTALAAVSNLANLGFSAFRRSTYEAHTGHSIILSAGGGVRAALRPTTDGADRSVSLEVKSTAGAHTPGGIAD